MHSWYLPHLDLQTLALLAYPSSPAYVSSLGNPNYLATEKIEYPKDSHLKQMELLVGLGFILM